jgi:hypothetical protein
MNRNISGSGAHVSALEQPQGPTFFILSSYKVPKPTSGVTESCEKADTRRVFSGPGPAIMAPVTFQPTAVSPAGCTGIAASKVIHVGS